MKNVLKLSEATAIALHAMIYISSKNNKICSLKEIAEKFDVSENHLSKVLQRFVKLGVLTSTKGPKGGFLITPEHNNMSFFEIYEIIEGKITQHNCIFNTKPHSCPKCIMNDLMIRVNNEFTDYMKGHKISDFSF